MKQKFICERLRKNSGYIGKVLTTVDGEKLIQISKSPPVGTIVCIGLDENDEPIIGWTLLDKEDNQQHSFSGLYGQNLALSRAEKFANGKPSPENPNLPSSLKAQVESFKSRARRYFDPGKFSLKEQKREGKLVKVWTTELEDNFDPDLTQYLTID